MIKIKKINPKNLTNEQVVGYNEKGHSNVGHLYTAMKPKDGIVCSNSIRMLNNCLCYIKIEDIDKEARRQIKELKKV